MACNGVLTLPPPLPSKNILPQMGNPPVLKFFNLPSPQNLYSVPQTRIGSF